MTKEAFCDLLGDIDDRYVRQARQTKRPVWVRWAAMAACLCLAVTAAVSAAFTQPRPMPPRDTEHRVSLTQEEAAKDPVFGGLFPTHIMEGYVLEGTVGIYGAPGVVLQAEFSKGAEDSFVIRIASKEWFLRQEPDLPWNTVRYRQTMDGQGSEICIDGGEMAVFYSFDRTDIADNADFYAMAASAAQFRK